ncbi:MAG: MmcQ/YjbR family DNA-binding protein [Marmoricola sp.]
MGIDADEVLDLAASLPESGEREYLEGSTIFTFRGRGMGYVSGDGRELFVKTTLAERAALVSTEPEVFSEWYTSGRFGWVRVQLALVDAEVARELVVEAFRLTAPKRLVREYDESVAVER